MSSEPKRTALFESHISAGAKMVDFHGYELPIWYSSIQEEHHSTRSSSGLFDVSHMGMFRFKGDNVREWLSSVSTQQYLKFPPGRCGYSHFLDQNGFIIDDMIFAVSSENEVLGVPNSTMVGTMLDWLSPLLPQDGSIQIDNLSEETSIIALQGPNSGDVLKDVLGGGNLVGSFRCQEIAENPLNLTGWIQGTGYTGENGVEIFLADHSAQTLWNVIIEDQRVSPVGLGARDTLRLEKGYLLSGQDFLWPEIGGAEGFPAGFLARTTVETAVPFGLDLSHDFVGKAPLVTSMKSGTRLWGMKCMGKGPSPRAGHAVLNGPGEDARIVGYVTSGAPSPSLGMTGIAMGYLSDCKDGSEVWIQSSTRRRVGSKVLAPPFL